MRSRSRNTAPISLFAFQDIIMCVTAIMLLITMMLALELLQKKQVSPEVITPVIANQVAVAVTENEREIARFKRVLAVGSDAIRVDAAIVRRRLEESRQAREELERQNAALAADLKATESRQSEIEKVRQQVTPERMQQLLDEVTVMQDRLQRLKAANRVIFNRNPAEPKTPWLLEIQHAGILAAEAEKKMRPVSFNSADELLAWARRQNAGSVYFVLLVKPDGAERFAPVREMLLTNGFEIGYDLLSADQQAIDRETGAGVE